MSAGLIDVIVAVQTKHFKGPIGKAVQHALEGIGIELTGAMAAGAPVDTGRLAKSMRHRTYRRSFAGFKDTYFLVAGPGRRL